MDLVYGTEIEIDGDRVETLRGIPGLSVQHANFLQVHPAPVYDRVVMNPPFSGTHWIQHVMHAFDFLRPGGRLYAILPYSAIVGTAKDQEAFRAWAIKAGNASTYDGEIRVVDLPEESFSSVGVRIQTCILELRR